MAELLHATYNDIHVLIKNAIKEIQEFKPELLIAIGGGGFFPARVLRTFLKDDATKKNLQIHAIGLSLYEPLPGATEEQIGNEIIRTQWLGPGSGKLLLGKRILIVDEVDDTRKTLNYAISELQEDVDQELLLHPESERDALRAQTEFGIFVVHNKLKPKLATLPSGTRYFAGAEVRDFWLVYPWEAKDIEQHDALAANDKAKLAKESTLD